MNFDSFFARKGFNQTSLASVLNTSSQNVNRWCRNIGKPSYEICKKLLELGMTVEELFDVKQTQDQPSLPKEYNSPEFMEGVAQAIADMKAKGLL